jgi:hypothetical protein
MINSPYEASDPLMMIDAPELDGVVNIPPKKENTYEIMLRNKPRGSFTSDQHRQDVQYLLNLVTHLRGY